MQNRPARKGCHDGHVMHAVNLSRSTRQSKQGLYIRSVQIVITVLALIMIHVVKVRYALIHVPALYLYFSDLSSVRA